MKRNLEGNRSRVSHTFGIKLNWALEQPKLTSYLHSNFTLFLPQKVCTLRPGLKTCHYVYCNISIQSSELWPKCVAYSTAAGSCASDSKTLELNLQDSQLWLAWAILHDAHYGQNGAMVAMVDWSHWSWYFHFHVWILWSRCTDMISKKQLYILNN